MKILLPPLARRTRERPARAAWLSSSSLSVCLRATSTGAEAAGPKAYHAPRDELADVMAIDAL